MDDTKEFFDFQRSAEDRNRQFKRKNVKNRESAYRRKKYFTALRKEAAVKKIITRRKKKQDLVISAKRRDEESRQKLKEYLLNPIHQFNPGS